VPGEVVDVLDAVTSPERSVAEVAGGAFGAAAAAVPGLTTAITTLHGVAG